MCCRDRRQRKGPMDLVHVGAAEGRSTAVARALPDQEWWVGIHPPVGLHYWLGFGGSLTMDTFLVDSYEHSFRCLGSAGSPGAFCLLYGQQHDPGKFLLVQLLSRLSSRTWAGATHWEGLLQLPPHCSTPLLLNCDIPLNWNAALNLLAYIRILHEHVS